MEIIVTTSKLLLWKKRVIFSMGIEYIVVEGHPFPATPLVKRNTQLRSRSSLLDEASKHAC
jgi:hypothetical protein